jgi:hypothetical protein
MKRTRQLICWLIGHGKERFDPELSKLGCHNWYTCPRCGEILRVAMWQNLPGIEL